jgi:predicted Zn-dependent protease
MSSQEATGNAQKVRWPVRIFNSRQAWLLLFLSGLVGSACFLVAPRIFAGFQLRAARHALKNYHNRDAIRHLQACLRTWPDDPEVLLLSARAARRARAYSDAEHFLARYVHMRGLDDAGNFEQILLAAERTIDQAAEPCWRQIEQGHPESALLFEALTRGYLRQYRLGEARMCLDRWLQLQPDNPEALSLDGQFHLDYARARSAAVESFRRALQIDEEHEDARLGLAVALLESKTFPEAAAHLEILQQRQPDNLRVRVGLAECRDALGDSKEAMRMLDDVLQRQPDYAPALSLRGRLALENSRSDEAETWLRRAVALDPKDFQARYNLILCLHNLDKEDEARRQKEELDRSEQDLKRFNEIVTKDMRQRPYDPDLHCLLGQLLLRSGYREEGLRWLHSALRLATGHAEARKTLTEYYQQSKTKPRNDD